MIHKEQIFSNCSYAFFDFTPHMWFFKMNELRRFEDTIYSVFKSFKAYKKMKNLFEVSIFS